MTTYGFIAGETTEAELRAFEIMAGTALMVTSPVDQARSTMLIRIGRTDAERAAIRRMVMDRRAAWVDYLVVQQRKWQAHTRRPSRARHHDSIAIRERYVRCS